MENLLNQLQSLIKAVMKPGREPNHELAGVADAYNQRYGVTTPALPPVKALDEAQSHRIADAYHAMPHDPEHPAVRASYDALKRETAQQFQHLLDNSYNFSVWDKPGEPYKDSAEMMEDVRKNKHLHFFPTVGDIEGAGGFGEGETANDHPLLEPTHFQLNGRPLLYNDVFRAVHDMMGHAIHGYQFGAKGEENAWRKHAGMYSEAAIPALTSETRGQNSWVNFGPHLRRGDGSIPQKGEPDWLHPTERPFADQKAGLLPQEFWKPGIAKARRWVTLLRKAQEPEHPWVTRAKEHFGTTTNPHAAGYILPNGEMLDFGIGPRLEGQGFGFGGGDRVREHDDLGYILNDDETEGHDYRNSRHHYIMEATGMARWGSSPEDGSFAEFVKPPTEQQIRTMAQHSEGLNQFHADVTRKDKNGQFQYGNNRVDVVDPEFITAKQVTQKLRGIQNSFLAQEATNTPVVQKSARPVLVWRFV